MDSRKAGAHFFGVSIEGSNHCYRHDQRTALKEISPVPHILPRLTEIDERIAIARGNLQELVEQATAYSGAAGEESMSQRIAEQKARIERLTNQRDELFIDLTARGEFG